MDRIIQTLDIEHACHGIYTDKQFIFDFVENHLFARDSLELRNYIIDVTPDFDLTLRIDSPENNYNDVLAVPIGVNFFWPRA